MSIFKFFLWGIFCFCSFFCEARQHVDDGFPCSFLDEYEVMGNKIYIQPEQLCITHEGIFTFVQGEQVIVRQLNCDENGIYCLSEHLDKIIDKCYNGHKIWCGRCGGCVVRWCTFRCKCVEWA